MHFENNTKTKTIMKEYFICFYEDVNDDGELIHKGELRRVSEEEMFKWVERARTEHCKISIYSATMVCDLS